MKKYILNGIIVLLVFMGSVHAQTAIVEQVSTPDLGIKSTEAKKSKLVFTSYQMLSVQYNGQKTFLQGHLSAGVKKNAFTYMIGNSFTSVPFAHLATYADVRYAIGKKQKFQLMGNLGTANLLNKNFDTYLDGDVWGGTNQEQLIRKNKPGLFYAMGVGTSVKLGAEVRYNVALVYSFTQLRFDKQYRLPSRELQTASISSNEFQWGLRIGLSF